MADSWMKAHDTAPVLSTILKGSDGQPADIADADVRVHVQVIHGDTIVDDDATNDQVGDGGDGTKGAASYEFPDGLDAGGYRYEWEVTYDGGEVETFPNDGWLYLAVVADLDEEAS